MLACSVVEDAPFTSERERVVCTTSDAPWYRALPVSERSCCRLHCDRPSLLDALRSLPSRWREDCFGLADLIHASLSVCVSIRAGHLASRRRSRCPTWYNSLPPKSSPWLWFAFVTGRVPAAFDLALWSCRSAACAPCGRCSRTTRAACGFWCFQSLVLLGLLCTPQTPAY